MQSLPFKLTGKRVYIAGHRGMVGSALSRRLRRENCELLMASSSDVDLREQTPTRQWIARNKPDVIFVAAAKVGGIRANDTFRADFIYDNLMIASNVINAAHLVGVEKLMFLGSSCIYPKLAPQPLREDALLTGALEPTNEPYAIAKIAGLKLAESYRLQYGDDFISVMPANLYGPGDNYHSDFSHVVPALIRRFHESKILELPQVEVWGSGQARREFLFVDDLADACIAVMRAYSDATHVNIGTGEDVTIKQLAELVARIVGYEGAIVFDASRPDGAPQKLLEVSRLASLGWRSSTSLEVGLEIAYRCFLQQSEDSSLRVN